MSSLSYLVRSFILIYTILLGSVESIPTVLVSSMGWKALDEVSSLQSGTTGVNEFLSCRSSAELMMAMASS